MFGIVTVVLEYLFGNKNQAWKFEIDTYRIQWAVLCGDRKAAGQLAAMVDEKAKSLPRSSLYTMRWTLDTLGEEVKRRLMYGVPANDTILWLERISNINDLLDAREAKLSDLQHGKT